MAFPDITKASGAVKRVFSVIDRQPGINPNADSGKHFHCHLDKLFKPVCSFHLRIATYCSFCLYIAYLTA